MEFTYCKKSKSWKRPGWVLFIYRYLQRSEKHSFTSLCDLSLVVSYSETETRLQAGVTPFPAVRRQLTHPPGETNVPLSFHRRLRIAAVRCTATRVHKRQCFRSWPKPPAPHSKEDVPLGRINGSFFRSDRFCLFKAFVLVQSMT